MLSCPEIGQLVVVRKRPFVVMDIVPSAVSPAPATKVTSHLIKLSSVEDDGLGEELEVLWELEPGTSVHEKSTLPEPTSFDDPKRLQAFLDAVRWGAISQSDDRALHSPFRSGIEIDDYQLDPVVRALSMPRVNLLIADDVGLGKTIEAGLVVQEMILRHRVRSVLIVCPSSLQLQWRDEMREKFGLEFRIIDSESISQLRRKRGIHVNPWGHFPRLITSIDFLKRERPLRSFRETLPAEAAYPRPYDLLIVDEAHNVAPPGRGCCRCWSAPRIISPLPHASSPPVKSQFSATGCLGVFCHGLFRIGEWHPPIVRLCTRPNHGFVTSIRYVLWYEPTSVSFPPCETLFRMATVALAALVPVVVGVIVQLTHAPEVSAVQLTVAQPVPAYWEFARVWGGGWCGGCVWWGGVWIVWVDEYGVVVYGGVSMGLCIFVGLIIIVILIIVLGRCLGDFCAFCCA